MDAFYASIEQREHPEWRGQPVIVGGSPESRGVVAACSYEAREFGVRSAMPCAHAARLCRHAIFTRPRMDFYRQISKQTRAIFENYSDLIEPMSIDEAFLQIPPARGAADDALFHSIHVAKALQHDIHDQLRLTCSLGVAANKFLAKLGSGLRKPNGITLIPERDKVAFLAPLPIRKIHGVGPASEKALNEIGIHTIGDLQKQRNRVESSFGAHGPRLAALSIGDDPRPLDTSDIAKSIGSETTFERNTREKTFIRDTLKALSGDVAGRLAKRKLKARTLTVKVRYGDFSSTTRQTTLDPPTHDATSLYTTACFIIRKHKLLERELRLLGVSASGLEKNSAVQLFLPFP